MRCAVYTRFSSDVQHPASITDQQLACQRYADRQSQWQVLPEHTYADEALSGMGVEHRPAYQRLLAAIAAPARPFDVLLVDDLSRLSRDAAEMLRLARLLEYAQITLISVADGIETGTKLSKLTLSVKAIFNEQYLDDLRERTLRGLHGRFARGLHTGGRIYGYRSVPRLDPSGRLDGAGQPLVLGVDLVVGRSARATHGGTSDLQPDGDPRETGEAGGPPAAGCRSRERGVPGDADADHRHARRRQGQAVLSGRGRGEGG